MKRKDLVDRRIALGLKQSTLANIIQKRISFTKVSTSTVVRWENGPTPIPDYVEVVMEELARDVKKESASGIRRPRTLQKWETINE
jgi:DNA-binding XRE family transcriptional regulator